MDSGAKGLLRRMVELRGRYPNVHFEVYVNGWLKSSEEVKHDSFGSGL